jgi:preprotein translocase subunit SecE
MARNRKRAKERRDRRPQPVSGRSRVAAARGDNGGGLPSPIEHAAPDVELANAQLELARVEAAADGEPQSDAELYESELTDGELAAAAETPSSEPPADGGGAAALPGPGVSEARPRPRARLAGFLEGSWRELQRVQWPDRRQVMQATAVVIGFVIVAGVWLGVADTLASHLMNYVLTGAKSALAWVAIAVIVLSVAGWAFLADRNR